MSLPISAEVPFRSILDHLTEGCQLIDPAWRYLYVNDTVAQHARMAREALLGRRMMDVYPGIERTPMFATLTRCMEERTFARMVNEFVYPDGSRAWFELSVQPVPEGLVVMSIDVTEHKETEARLAMEKERLAVTLRSIGDAVITTDDQARVTMFNEVAEALTGWGSAEALGRPLAEVFQVMCEGRRALFDGPWSAVMEEGRTTLDAGSCELVARDGVVRPIAATIAPIRGVDGRPFGVVLVCRDQTRERQAEEATHSRDALLRAFSDTIPDPIFLKDREGRLLFANPAVGRVMGRPVEALLGKTPSEIYDDPTVSASVIENDQRVMGSGVAEVIEERLRTRDGYRVYLASKVPYRDAQGRVVGLIGSSRDITDRKHMEAALRERLALQEQFARTASTVPGLICSYRAHPDGSAEMPFSTPATMDLYGLTQEELARDVAPMFARVHPDDVQALREGIEAAGASMTPWHAEFRYQHPSKGARWIEGWSVPQREPDESILWHGFVMDVTARHEAEAALHETGQQLQAAQRMEAVGRLAGGVAHDFNNLLCVIGSYTDFALMTVTDAGVLADLEEIRKASKRAEALTRQLLAFSRKQILQPAVVDLNQLAASTEKMLRRLIAEDIEMVFTPDPALWKTRVDPGQIEQVLMNLAVNASDAMPDGGRLTLTTANVTLDDAYAEHHVDARAGDYAALTVSDTGTGMSDETRARIFEPFFTTKGPGKGTGLGLAMVYGIVKQSGGSIAVETAPDRGATFKIYLPRDDGALSVDSARARPLARAEGSETVLVVEDEEGVRNLARRILSAAGYTVLTAVNGDEAVAACERPDAQVSLLLTDVVMPGVNGRDLARRLVARWPTMRVLYMSGYTDDAIAHRGVLEPGTKFIGKPFSVEALTRKVRSVLDEP